MFIPKGGGLVVAASEGGGEICKLSALGLGDVKLMRQFGQGFPDHPAKWLVEHAPKGGQVAKAPFRRRRAQREGRTSGRDDDISLIED